MPTEAALQWAAQATGSGNSNIKPAGASSPRPAASVKLNTETDVSTKKIATPTGLTLGLWDGTKTEKEKNQGLDANLSFHGGTEEAHEWARQALRSNRTEQTQRSEVNRALTGERESSKKLDSLRSEVAELDEQDKTWWSDWDWMSYWQKQNELKAEEKNAASSGVKYSYTDGAGEEKTERQRMETALDAAKTTKMNLQLQFDELQSQRNSLIARDNNPQTSMIDRRMSELQSQIRQTDSSIQRLQERIELAKKPTEWEGRDALVKELDEIDTNSGWITDPDEANRTAARRTEIIKALEAGDEAAGNGVQSYGDVERGRSIFGGATKDYASGMLNNAGTVLDTLYEGVNTNPYSGWATDAMTAEVIQPERDPDQLKQYQFLQTAGKALEQTADQLGENAARDLAQAKAGLGKFGQAGVDVATNIIQMGYDAGIGSLLGGGHAGLIPMFVRSSGSSAREARLNGANASEQFWYGAIKGSIEIGTELLGNGVSNVLSKAYGKGFADDAAEEIIRRLVKSDTGRTLARLLGGAAGEGTEEAISDLLAPLAEKVYNREDTVGELYRKLDPKEVVYDYLIGAVIGGMGGATGILTGANRAANEKLMATDVLEEISKRTEAELPAGRTEAKTGNLQSEETQPAGEETVLTPTEERNNRDLDAETLREEQRQLRAQAQAGEETGLRLGAAEDIQSGNAAEQTEGENDVEDQAETEPGLLGQETETQGAGEETAGAEPPDSGADELTAGTETAVGAETEDAAGGSDGREPGGRAGGEAAGVAGDAGTGSAVTGTGRAGGRTAGQSIGDAVRRSGTRPISSKEIGLSEGTDEAIVYPVADEYLTDELRQARYSIQNGTGCEVEFVAGPMQVTGTDGKIHNVNGFYDPVNNRIVARVDGKYTAEQIAKHESFHAKATADPDLVDEIRERITQRYGKEELRAIVSGYIKMRRGLWNSSDPAAVGVEANEILEEIFADAYAGMNAFGLRANRYNYDAWTTTSDRAQSQNGAQAQNTRGPPRYATEEGQAKTADLADLDLAKEMEQQDVASETIRQQTGWFKDGDGKWHFEGEETGTEGKTATVKPGPAVNDNEGKNELAQILLRNIDAIKDMEPVANLTGTEMNDRTKTPKQQINEYFDSLGNSVTRDNFGEIELGEYGADAVINHKPLNRVRMVTIEAVPEVLKHGELINYDRNWKDRKYPSYVFAAPVTIAGEPVYVAAVVNKVDRNKFYLNEAIDSNGNYVRISEGPSDNTKIGFTVQDGVTEGPLEPSDNSISEREAESKQKLSADDEDYQLTLDDVSDNEMYKSGLHPGMRQKYEDVQQLRRELRDLYRGVDENSDQWISEEDIDDLTDFNLYNNDHTASDMNGADQIIDSLLELSEDEGKEGRERIYYLIERLLPHIGAAAQQIYTGKGYGLEARNENFASWYGERHPSIYYPGYRPGDLLDTWDAEENREREIEHLSGLIDSGRLSGDELEDARTFLRRLQRGAEKFYSADEVAETELQVGEQEDGRKRRTDESLETAEERTIRELREANKELQKAAEYWQKQGRITEEGQQRAKRSDVKKIADTLMEHADYQGDRTELTGMVQELADMVVSNNEGYGLNWEDVRDAAETIAEELVDHSYTIIDPEADTRQSLRNRLKALKIRPDGMWTNDIADWQDFRRRQFGTMVFSNEGQNIDDVYQALRSEYGDGLFPEDITAGSDQVYQILKALEELKPQRMFNFANDQEAEMASAYYTDRITDEVLYGQLRPELTKADINYNRIKERLRKADRTVREVRQEARRKATELEKMQRYEVRAALENQRETMRNRNEKEKIRKKIDKTGKRLLKYLTENSGKNPIPEPMKEAVGRVLMDLDLSRGMEQGKKKRYLRNMQEVSKIVAQQNAYMQGDTDKWGGMYLDLPTDTVEQLNEHLSAVQKAMEETEAAGKVWNPNMMGLEELQRLDEILTTLTTAITNANEILSDARGAKISQEAGEGIKHLKSLGVDRPRSETGGKISKFLRFQNTTPYYFFRKLGEPGVKMFERLQDGWDKFAFNAKQVVDFANETYTEKEAKDIQNEVHEFKLRRKGDMSEGFDKPETVTMTKAQIMSLYCLWKREQARGHLAGAGIRVADYKDGKRTVTQGENYLLDLEDIGKIIDTLTDREKQIADALQKYMNTVGSDWGNEVSMKRFGIRSFTEENYFPIQTDDRSRALRNPASDAANLFRLLNMSFTKSTVKEASNSIVIDNIFDVFANHMADMAKYNGLGLPMLDAMKWFSYSQTGDLDENGQYGYDSIQKQAEIAYGREARKYFTSFMQDLNGTHEAGRGEDLASRMMSNYKIAAVGANLRVAMLQPTSYLRAAAVISPKYLAKGLTMSNRAGQAEAAKNSGTATWKDLGFYDTNINAGLRDMIKHADGTKEKLQEFSMKGAELGDKTTWGALWNACKAEQMDKGLKGDALTEATAKRFREVVYRTQVMDSTMTRSHVMRQKGAYAGMMTAFMSEPTLSYNMLLDAYGDYENQRRQGKSKAEAWKNSGSAVGKAAGAYVATAIMSAIVESLIDAARDDDEYATYLERFSEKLLGKNGNLMQDLLIHNKLPIVKDFFSMLSGDGTSRMDTEWMNTVIKAAQIWKETLALQLGLQDEPTKATYNGNMTTWGKIYQTLRAASQLSGLPMGNGIRDALALWNSTAGEAKREWKVHTYDPGEEKKIKYAVKDGYLTEDEAVELLQKYELAENEEEARQMAYVWAHPEKYERLINAMNEGDRAEFAEAKKELEDLRFKRSGVEAAVKNEVERRYVGNEEGAEPIDRQTAVDMLVEYGGMLERKAEALVQKWTCEAETGVPYSEIGNTYLAGDLTKDQAVEMLMEYGGLKKEKAEAQVQKWSSELDTGINYSEIDDEFLYGGISKDEALEMYQKYGGKTEEEALDTVKALEFERDTGHKRERAEIQEMYINGDYSRDEMKRMMVDYGYSKTEESAENSLIRWDFIGTDYEELDDVSPWQARTWFDELEDAGIGKKEYLDFAQTAETIKGDKDENGKSIPYSKMDKIFALIDSMDLTPEQKDALALAGWDSSNDGYSEKNLSRAPWHDGESTTKKKSSGKKSSGGRGGGGRRSSGGRKSSNANATPVYDPANTVRPENGRSWGFNRIMNLWRRKLYNKAQVLAAVKSGEITQEEAEEILAMMQDLNNDGSLVLGAAENT